MKTNVLVGVTGGIAAVKIPSLLTLLLADHTDVDVIETANATRILPPKAISAITGKPVFTSLYPPDFNPQKILRSRSVEHITLAGNASLFVIAPATANIIAKLAHGIADDYLTTTALAVTCPIMICPSMNTHMWKHPATQENIRKIKSLGYIVLPPDCGDLACGYSGEGRLPDVTTIFQEIQFLLEQKKILAGKRVLVTTGGTTESIDSVRTISNRSSGKMGIAIAEACFHAGASVRILRSKTSVRSRYGIQEFEFESAADLELQLREFVPQSDILFHVAAVSDFSVKNPFTGKYSSKKPIHLTLKPQKKLLNIIKTLHPNIFLVAFKAEYNVTNEKLIAIASQRFNDSASDIIIANDVARSGIGFQSDENEVICIPKQGNYEVIERSTKNEIARKIVSKLAKFMG